MLSHGLVEQVPGGQTQWSCPRVRQPHRSEGSIYRPSLGLLKCFPQRFYLGHGCITPVQSLAAASQEIQQPGDNNNNKVWRLL